MSVLTAPPPVHELPTPALPPTPAAHSGGIHVSVIVVSYNTRDITLACLRSIFDRTRNCRFEVIVIDNASSDGSPEAIAAAFPDVRLIANAQNRGFAAANNQGMRVARGKYLLLLNSDTEVNADTLSSTFEFAEAHRDIGVIGCRAYLADGQQQSTLFRHLSLGHVLLNVAIPNTVLRRTTLLTRARYPHLDLDQSHDVDIVAGCFMFVRRSAYEHVGGMDESFFMYAEEAEWCYRFTAAGWRVCYFPGASILHYGSVSTSQCMDEMNLAMARSHLLLLMRTRGRMTAHIANALMLLRDLPRAALWRVLSPLQVPRNQTLRDKLKRSAERCGFHARCLLRMDLH